MIRELQDKDLREIAVVSPTIIDVPEYRSVVVNDTVVAVFGFQNICPGVGQAWISVNPRSKGSALAIIKAGRELVGIAFKERNLHRLQTAVLSTDERMCKMMKMCGFSAESILSRASATGLDLIMFCIVKGD